MRRKITKRSVYSRFGGFGTGQGNTHSKKLRIGIAVAEFNADITEALIRGALSELKASGVQEENIIVRRVPGSFELPLACAQFAATKKYDALIALGCVIKGETDHYYYVAGEAARGIMEVMLKHAIPIGFGVLTTNTLQQAKDRSGTKENAGAAAASAALRMISSN